MTFPVFASGGADPTAPTYPVQRSVRLQRANSARLSRTFTTPTSQNIFTWSAWVKRGVLSSTQGLFGPPALSSYFGFSSADNLTLVLTGNPTLTSTSFYRDPSSWYHIMYVQNGTSVTVYANGLSVLTGTSTNTVFNTAVAHVTGATTATTPANFFDGLLTLNYFIDGQALTPTSFGGYNPGTNVWEPIRYTGTYGTNGYFLQFLDNSGSTATTLGKDTSGNGNNWTPANINTVSPTNTNYDSFTDVPTNTSFLAANFCVLNQLDKATTITVSAANLAATASANNVMIRSSIRISANKFYWEATGVSIAMGVVLVGASLTGAVGSDAFGWGYDGTGNKITNGVSTAYGATFTTTDIIGIAFDGTAGTLEFYKNGTSQGVAFTGLTAGLYYPAFTINSTTTLNANFGQRPFTYTVPSGYQRLTTYVIGNTVNNSSKVFATTPYTGTIAGQTISNARNGVTFAPDMVFVKGRSAATPEVIYDTVRGASRLLVANSTAADTSNGAINAFTSTGFTVGSSASFPNTNSNGLTYLAYQWLAGGSTTSWNFDGTLNRSCTVATGATTTITLNTNGFSAGQAIRFTGTLPTGLSAGTTYYAGGVATNTFNVYDTEANAITGGATGKIVTSGSGSGMACYHASKISVNRQTGVSIVYYVGTGANTTIGHGLNKTLDCAIIKSTTAVTNWPVYHTSLGNTNYMNYNGTTASTADSTYWNNTSPTSLVFSVGTSTEVNANGAGYITYAFATVPGFSAFGSFTGNGGTDGPFNYLGHKPRYLTIKRTGVQSWITLNGASQTYNVQGPYLFIDSSSAEGTATALVDFLSNGFKLKSGNVNTNTNASIYVYMSWAECPFKFSVAG